MGKSLIRTTATFFSQNPKPFRQYFKKISWEPPKITSQKSPKTSDSWNTKMLPIPTAISTKTGSFELKYEGRRTRNTQVCRHKITAYVYLLYMASCARPISEKLVFEPFLKSWFSNMFLVINLGNNILVYFGIFWSQMVPRGPRWSPKVPRSTICTK